MIKTLWRNFKHWFDPYYELSSDEVERLIVVKQQYLDALASLSMAKHYISEQIEYLEEKIAAIDRALKRHTEDKRNDDLPF